ncbi:MAG: bifunctional nicotinamidase/pyrazinamidase [Bacteroidia bacterium]|nr:bifunctional nicotinamidase/pyrazinamidase [Bacteroidia bacterium]
MKALILVDIQNDFVPGGALAVNNGADIIPVIHTIMPHFELIVATQDWHPLSHESFAANHPGEKTGNVIDLHGLPQILWPVHCVQHTKGAEFVESLDMSRVNRIFHKGTDKTIDSYSGFFDNGRRGATGMGEFLMNQGVKEVYVVGLATDYCVKYTAMDAVSLGFKTVLIEDACRGVNLQPGDVTKAIEEMRRNGVEIVDSSVFR